MTKTLKNKTLLITGGSRGIGEALAYRCAKDGANIVIAAKTQSPHPSLPGTIHSVAENVEKLGGRVLAIKMNILNDDEVVQAVNQTVDHFGGIDILINNASAIDLRNSETLPIKRFDLMLGVNARGTYHISSLCAPHLKKSSNPHILTFSPPLSMQGKWFKDHLAYSLSKYGMSMCMLGMAEEFRDDQIACNALWPKTTIATAAILVNFPKEIYEASRKPDIMADAAYWVLTQPSSELTAQFLIDEDVLRQVGVQDFSHYALKVGVPLYPDLYVEKE